MITYQYKIQILPREEDSPIFVPVFDISEHEEKDDDEYEDIHDAYEAVAEMQGFESLLVRDEAGKVIGSVGFDDDGWGAVTAESWISMDVAKKMALDKCKELRDAFTQAVEKIDGRG